MFFFLEEYTALLIDYDESSCDVNSEFDSEYLTKEQIYKMVDSFPPKISENISQPLEFILSIRGNPQLVYDGQTYNFEKMSSVKKMWQCTQSQRFKCRARLFTIGSRVFVTHNVHSHPKTIGRLKDNLPDDVKNVLGKH